MALPTTSGTAAFLVTRDDIIKAALRKLRVIGIGETPTTEDYTNLAFALNMLLKELDTEGYLSWVYQTIAIPFVASQTTYTIAEAGTPDFTGYRPVKIAHVWRRDGSTPPIDTPMSPLSRQQYDQMTPKAQTGVPTNWYYDPQLGNTVGGATSLPTVYVWPTPLDTTYTMYLCIQRPIQDIATTNPSTQNFDVTQEWFRTLQWMLADEVSHDYEVDLATLQDIRSVANGLRKKLADFSQEDASIILQPDPQMAYGSRFNS